MSRVSEVEACVSEVHVSEVAVSGEICVSEAAARVSEETVSGEICASEARVSEESADSIGFEFEDVPEVACSRPTSPSDSVVGVHHPVAVDPCVLSGSQRHRISVQYCRSESCLTNPDSPGSIDLSELQMARLTDVNARLRIRESWIKIMFPLWPSVSMLSSYADMESFCDMLSFTFLYPKEFASIKTPHILYRFFLKPQDVVAAKLAIQLHRGRASVPKTIYANYYADTEVGDLGVMYADTVFPDSSSSVSHNLICAHGPSSILNSEMQIHGAGIIAPSLFVASVLDSLTNQYEKAAVSRTHHALTTLHTITLFGMMCGIFHSTIQILFCSIASIDDKLSASYLSVPIWLRFLDIFMFLTLFLTTIPAAQITQASLVHDSWPVAATSACASLFWILSVASALFCFGRMWFSPRKIDSVFSNHSEFHRILRAIGNYRKMELGVKAREYIIEKSVDFAYGA